MAILSFGEWLARHVTRKEEGIDRAGMTLVRWLASMAPGGGYSQEKPEVRLDELRRLYADYLRYQYLGDEDTEERGTWQISVDDSSTIRLSWWASSSESSP